MAKIINLTEKLNFAQPPAIRIFDKEYPVNNDASTFLKIVDVLNNKGEIGGLPEAIGLIFGEKKAEEIINLEHDGRKMTVTGLQTIVSSAIELITEESAEGET